MGPTARSRREEGTDDSGNGIDDEPVNRYPWFLPQGGEMVRQETIIYAKRLSRYVGP